MAMLPTRRCSLTAFFSIKRIAWTLATILFILPAPLAWAKTKPVMHKVKAGDSLWSIAGKYKVEVDTLRKLNKIKGNMVKPGAKLIVRPGSSKGKSIASATKHSSKSTKVSKTSGTQITKSQKSAGKISKNNKKAKKRFESVQHKVKRGDSLWSIARKYNTTVTNLRKINGKSVKSLHPGEVIVVKHVPSGDGPVRLEHGVQLPESGLGFVAPRRERVWGTKTTVTAIMEACAETAAEHPEARPTYIGDVSYQRGGYMPPHKSHRSGRDVDLSYYHNDPKSRHAFTNVSTSTLDTERSWTLIESFLETKDVKSMYIDYRLQKPLYEEALRRGIAQDVVDRLFEYPDGVGSGKEGQTIIRHVRGHDDHIHIRFYERPEDVPSS